MPINYSNRVLFVQTTTLVCKEMLDQKSFPSQTAN